MSNPTPHQQVRAGTIPRRGARAMSTTALCAVVVAGCGGPAPAAAPSSSRALPDVAAAPLPALELRADGVQVCPVQTDYLFDNGSADLQPSAERLLERCLEPVLLAAGSGRPIRVVGYADGVGDAGANLDLSSRRSSRVAEWLTARGVPATGLTSEGRGEQSAADAVPDPDQRRVVVEIGP
jgi:outer membrane protein OmpA-like peptidoglycan-associated protein